MGDGDELAFCDSKGREATGGLASHNDVVVVCRKAIERGRVPTRIGVESLAGEFMTQARAEAVNVAPGPCYS